MKNVLLTCLVLLIVASTYAQSIKIKGTIVDEKSNENIVNATVKLVHTNEYTVSNLDGEFSILAAEGDMVEVSHISYKTIVVALKNQQIIKLQLAPIDLNEIIVSANPLEDISQSTEINDVTKRVSQPRSVGDLFKDINDL